MENLKKKKTINNSKTLIKLIIIRNYIKIIGLINNSPKTIPIIMNTKTKVGRLINNLRTIMNIESQVIPKKILITDGVIIRRMKLKETNFRTKRITIIASLSIFVIDNSYKNCYQIKETSIAMRTSKRINFRMRRINDFRKVFFF